MKKIKFILISVIALAIIFNIAIIAAVVLPDGGAKISSSAITQVKTGTAPFDSNDEPGNDSSDSNNIIRSFDQITWTLENTMALKDNTDVSFSGGKIYFEAKLPNVLNSETAKWNLESMSWIENAQVSSDGLTLTGYYQMSEKEETVPGKQNLVFVANILGAPNNLKFNLTVKTWLNGNSESEKAQAISETITVSAAPKYNIMINKNSQLSKKTTVDINGSNVEGRMYGFGLGLMLYGDNASKGLRGIEYPKGDITFELTSKIEKISMLDTSNVQDITSQCTPLLYDYKINDKNTNIGNLGNNMNFGKVEHIYAFRGLPLGVLSNPIYSIYNSGNVVMRQQGNKIYVTIKDYKFNGVFPKYNGYIPDNDEQPYSDHVGFFSSVYFEVLVPFNDVNKDANYNYYYTISDTNFSATSISGTKTNKQTITSDDSLRFQNVIIPIGTYNNHTRIYDINNSSIADPYSAGNAYASIGEVFRAWSDTIAGFENDEENTLYTLNKLVKFDGEGFEPVKYGNNYYVTAIAEFIGSPYKYKMWFATKPDGTNWSSQSEMNTTYVDSLVLYENLEDIPEGHLCIGEYYETQTGYLTNGYAIIHPFLRVKETAKIGNTYAVTQVTKAWTENLDRSIYTATNKNVQWPKTAFDSSNRNYIKTEYDENGVQITGTHNGGMYYGNSVLVQGGKIFADKKAINLEDRSEKVNYDFSKNEYEVNFVITSRVQTSVKDLGTITLKIEDNLPVGMSYAYDSCNYGDPKIVTSSNGTKLIWYINDVDISNIPTIEYKAYLDESLPNGASLESKVVVTEVPYKDSNGNDKYKLGRLPTSITGDNQHSVGIQIINLASHRLYKRSYTAVIEKNQDIHYMVSYKNNTDSVISDFQLLDILPYNGDDRGTNYSGEYTVDRIVVTQKDGTSKVISNENLEILYTTDKSVRDKVTSKDEDLGQGWSRVNSETIKQKVVALAIKGEVGAQGSVVVDIYMKTNENKGLDKYVNSATAQVYKDTEEIKTGNVATQVVERSIEGIAWEDENKNGLKDENEKVISDIEITLTDALGQQVIDVNGQVVTSVKTDSNGYYRFGSLPKGEYYAQVLPNEKYELTEKQVGSNSEINSKFDEEKRETDKITGLNSIYLPELTVSNVNVGLIKIVGTIEVTKVDKSDNNKVIEGATFKVEKLDESGNVDNTYEAIELITGKDGKVLFENLEVGKYRVTESKAPEGYQLSKTSIEVEITGNNRSIKLIAENEMKIELPEAGEINYTIIFSTIGIIVMFIAIVIIKFNNKISLQK